MTNDRLDFTEGATHGQVRWQYVKVTGTKQPPGATKWSLIGNEPNLAQDLNQVGVREEAMLEKLGNLGWELVTVTLVGPGLGPFVEPGANSGSGLGFDQLLIDETDGVTDEVATSALLSALASLG